MEYLWASLLSIFGLICLLLTLVGLPGNWLIVVAAVIYKWVMPDELSWWVIGAVLVLALIGEIIEFFAGMIGSSSAGGSRWGAGGALLGGIAGAIVGTFALPIPVVGSIVGACLGAALGAWSMEISKGQKSNGEANRIAIGAGIGRLVGTVAKFGVGIVMWLAITIAIFWP